MFSRAAGRVVRLSSGVAVLQGTCHPPLAAHTRLTPRHWKEADDQVGLGFRVGTHGISWNPTTPPRVEKADATLPLEQRGTGARDAPKGGLPLFLFCHANGFCKEVWKPVVEELSKLAREPFRWIAMDFCGQQLLKSPL